MSKLDSTRLKEVLSYDPKTGIFTWIYGNKRNTKPGDIAGMRNPEGYWFIGIGSKNYAAHRLAWLYIHGEFPINQIDHINGIKNDNRIANLRTCTHAENQQTKRSVKGYSWHKSKKRFIAYIKVNKKRIELGRYLNEQDARQAYLNAKSKYHFFAIA